MENELPALTSTWNTELSCLEQVDALTGESCAGETLIHGPQFHALKPPAECVWALKTGDVRIFGWFTAQISLLQVQHGSRAADLVGCDHSSVLGARLEPFKNYLAFALKSSQLRGVGIL
jgi:hypothetical protein